jgi:cellulose biosynthesis protein BcsQ
VRLAEAPSYGVPILAYHANSPGAKAYEELAREVLAADGVAVAV